MRVRDRKNSDPGWIKFGSGINIPDPQHCFKQPRGCVPVPGDAGPAGEVVFLHLLRREVPEISGCGTVTIFYGSGSDFRKVMVPVPTFEKLWFRFQLLKSYGSGSNF
jgi:hypothetical protein